MSEPTKRVFNVDSDLLLMSAALMLDNFIKYMQRFIEENPILFSEDYHLIFADLIAKARALKSDVFYRKEMIKETEDVNEALAKCFKLLKRIKKNVKDAFGEGTILYNQFNFDVAEDYRKSPDRILPFLECFHETVETHQDKLLSVGMKTNSLDEIKRHGENILKEYKEQQRFINERPFVTNERNIMYNKVHDEMKAICDMAELIFEDEPMIRDLFKMPSDNSSSSSSTPKEEKVVADETIPDEENSDTPSAGDIVAG